MCKQTCVNTPACRAILDTSAYKDTPGVYRHYDDECLVLKVKATDPNLTLFRAGESGKCPGFHYPQRCKDKEMVCHYQYHERLDVP